TLRQGFKLPHTQVDRPMAKVAPMITRPINGERFAIDPRVPLSSQRLQLRLSHVPDSVKQIIWQVNNDTLIGQHAATAEWPLRAGDNTVSATLMGDDGSQTTVSGVRFYVEGLTPELSFRCSSQGQYYERQALYCTDLPTGWPSLIARTNTLALPPRAFL